MISMHLLLTFLAMLCLVFQTAAAEPVTLDTLVRAETDTAMRGTLKVTGGIGKLFHFRGPTPLDKQVIIRMNRDTLYSGVLVDLSEPVTVVLPKTGGRYLSMHVVNQDHYMYVITKPGRHRLTQRQVGTRYAQISFRTFVDTTKPEDVKAANAIQDKIKVSGGGSNSLEMPEWDQEQLATARKAMSLLATMGLDAGRAFGRKGQVDSIHFVVGAVAAWGGLPKEAAVYVFDSVEKNDGTPYAVTAKDVPVDAFWSITVYNEKGFIEKNDRGVYSFNSMTAKKGKDGAITVHFGGCEDGRVNCLPIKKSWNYTVRLYEPRKEIISGAWKFPELKQIQK
jgi:hypothetical protein